MQANIETGLAIRIDGELGKFNTLPIDKLIEIGQSLQELVQAIAGSETLNPDNFKIELSGFTKGSAIPVFKLPSTFSSTLYEVSGQRKEIVDKLNALLEISDENNFSGIEQLYPDALKRNEIVAHVFKFTNSFGTSPVEFGSIDEAGRFNKKYKLHILKKELKDKLLIDIVKKTDNIQEEKAYATIKITHENGRAKRKIDKVFKKESNSISYSPDFIVIGKRKYIFTNPLRCSLENEDGHWIIQNELLDIYSVGQTEDEAIKDFIESFDYLYQRLNGLKEHEISDRLKKIKTFINEYVVKNVGEW